MFQMASTVSGEILTLEANSELETLKPTEECRLSGLCTHGPASGLTSVILLASEQTIGSSVPHSHVSLEPGDACWGPPSESRS